MLLTQLIEIIVNVLSLAALPEPLIQVQIFWKCKGTKILAFAQHQYLISFSFEKYFLKLIAQNGIQCLKMNQQINTSVKPFTNTI